MTKPTYLGYNDHVNISSGWGWDDYLNDLMINKIKHNVLNDGWLRFIIIKHGGAYLAVRDGWGSQIGFPSEPDGPCLNLHLNTRQPDCDPAGTDHDWIDWSK